MSSNDNKGKGFSNFKSSFIEKKNYNENIAAKGLCGPKGERISNKSIMQDHMISGWNKTDIQKRYIRDLKDKVVPGNSELQSDKNTSINSDDKKLWDENDINLPQDEGVAESSYLDQSNNTSRGDDFIKSYSKVLNSYICEDLINLGQSSIITMSNGIEEQTIRSNVIPLDSFQEMRSKSIREYLRNNLFSPYIKQFPVLHKKSWVNFSIGYQKLEPEKGYKNIETIEIGNSSWYNNPRSMMWIVFLNDVEEGGGLEFGLQNLIIKPEAGMGVVWPASFTHSYLNSLPKKGEKHILIGSISLISEMEVWSESPETFKDVGNNVKIQDQRKDVSELFVDGATGTPIDSSNIPSWGKTWNKK